MRIGVQGLLVVTTLVLAGAIASQYLARSQVPGPRRATPVNGVLPDLPGWISKREALGPTEAASGAAAKVLNFDDHVYQRYERAGKSFTLYIAYWAPGRMPARLVASHTPDRCWTENGMRCVDMRFRQALELGGKPLLPAEIRTFTPEASSEKTFVAYWHTVGGKSYDYGGRFNAVPHPWLWWKDTLAQAMHGSREQLFVRITSTTPLAELWQDRDFQSVMEKVADLGLWAAP